ncbi:MAG: hypothetical protein V4487_04995 [Chlamydiota bacterium]
MIIYNNFQILKNWWYPQNSLPSWGDLFNHHANLKKYEEAMHFAINAIPVLLNDPDRGGLLKKRFSCESDFDLARKQISLIRKQDRDYVAYYRTMETKCCYRIKHLFIDTYLKSYITLPPQRQTPFVRALMEGNEAIDKGLGACAERVYALFCFLLVKAPYTRVEIFFIWKGDHAIAVCGRALNGTLDPKTWGEKAFVIESWDLNPSVYRASELGLRLIGNSSYTKKKEEQASKPFSKRDYSPHIIPFNPKLHKLSLAASSAWSPNDLSEKESWDLYFQSSNLKKTLGDFHLAQNRDGKVKAAHKVLKELDLLKLHEDDDDDREVLRDLRNQMLYAIDPSLLNIQLPVIPQNMPSFEETHTAALDKIERLILNNSFPRERDSPLR